jgi:hypothetical protein
VEPERDDALDRNVMCVSDPAHARLMQRQRASADLIGALTSWRERHDLDDVETARFLGEEIARVLSRHRRKAQEER